MPAAKRKRVRLLLTGGMVLLGMALAAAAGNPGADPVPELCAQAHAAADHGNITEAVLDYNRAVALGPDRSTPYIGLAVLYEALDRSDLAIEALEQLQMANPEAPHLGCRLTEAHLGVEDVRTARELGAAAIAREPDCARAFASYGIALARSRYWQSAAVALQRAMDLAPEDGGIGETLVNVRIQQGEYAAAAQLAERLLRTHGESPKLHYHAGVAYTQLREPGATERAMTHLRRTSELAPTWFEPHAELGRLYQGRGETGPAVEEFQAALQINPDVPGVAYNLALLWRKLGDPRARSLSQRVPTLTKSAGGLDTLRALAFQEPDNVKNLVATAEEEARQGQFAPALFRLRRRLRVDPADLAALTAYRKIDNDARARHPDYLRPGPGLTAR